MPILKRSEANPQVAQVFASYPEEIQSKVMSVRELIFETARDTEGVDKLEETLKWGEPSYVTQGGSTVRVAWKNSAPDHYGVYFHCKTKLIDTFKELYRDKFRFEGDRAILFHKDEKIPVDELKHCIALSLTYHRRKNLPLLGV
jgi:hypothetical protein